VDAVARLRQICLALPQAVEKPFGGHTSPSLRVGEKLFVMVSKAQDAVTFKARPGVQQELVAAEPERFYVPAYVGHNGWVGARLDVEQDWDELADLVTESWRMTAPKRAVRDFDG
jgi:hypothetical protein